jgi:prephenate dehydratase
MSRPDRRLSFLGPPGTFSEEAALRYDPEAQLIACPTVSAAAAAVDSGGADEAVVPIENSLEGAVTETLDILIRDDELFIRDEIVLPIEHLLLVRPGTNADAITVIVSHPQSLAQCRGFVEKCYPKAQIEAALSNSAAVEEMMQREDAAAIGNRRSAELYGAEALAEGIQDSESNVTRFVVLAHEDHEPTGDDKTSLAFAFAVEDRPGLLVSALEEFSSRGINLSKIESRPSKERLGVYVFLADLDGHRSQEPMAETLARVREKCSYFRVLGSYPRHRKA